MKVLAICGSPRQGNTEQMLIWVLDSLKSANVETELILMKDKDIKFCGGCSSTCYNTGYPCRIEDDMEEILSKMIDADAIILGSPNYFTNISAQLKLFMDRTNPLCKPPLLKDKIAGFICVGARPVNESEILVSIFKEYCREMKMSVAGSVVGRAEDPGEISNDENIKLACANLGNKILDQLRG